MKRIFLFAAAVFCAFTGIFFSEKLPADTARLTEKKYDSWSGVIRIWAAEGCGAESWLAANAHIIEKQNEGVYISVQTVPGYAISGLPSAGINPPDIIIYPAGLSADTSLLSPITATYPLRDSIRQSAYAVPLLLRSKFWIYDASLGALPGDMYTIPAACADADAIALTALCTGLRHEEAAQPVLPGLDLGLSGGSEPTPPPTGSIACRVSPDIITDASPVDLFQSGEVKAFVGGIADALRLDDCAAAATGTYAYADEAIMYSIIEKNDGRGEICRELLDVLMTDGQALAARAQAFPAVVGASAWSGDPLLAGVEAALTDKIWLAGTYNTSTAYLYIQGKITADDAIRRTLR